MSDLQPICHLHCCIITSLELKKHEGVVVIFFPGECCVYLFSAKEYCLYADSRWKLISSCLSPEWMQICYSNGLLHLPFTYLLFFTIGLGTGISSYSYSPKCLSWLLNTHKNSISIPSWLEIILDACEVSNSNFSKDRNFFHMF